MYSSVRYLCTWCSFVHTVHQCTISVYTAWLHTHAVLCLHVGVLLTPTYTTVTDNDASFLLVPSSQSDVDAWISGEQFGKAFDLALTRSDLPLVMYICKQINPEELFDQQPPPVSQAILLSLVHHLAADFSEDLDLKLK